MRIKLELLNYFYQKHLLIKLELKYYVILLKVKIVKLNYYQLIIVILIIKWEENFYKV